MGERREALRAGHSAVRLLVPTATLAQHLQNQLAREGFVFRRGLVQTLSGFVRDLCKEDAARFVALGERRLKGFAEKAPVFRFEWRN